MRELEQMIAGTPKITTKAQCMDLLRSAVTFRSGVLGRSPVSKQIVEGEAAALLNAGEIFVDRFGENDWRTSGDLTASLGLFSLDILFKEFQFLDVGTGIATAGH